MTVAVTLNTKMETFKRASQSSNKKKPTKECIDDRIFLI